MQYNSSMHLLKKTAVLVLLLPACLLAASGSQEAASQDGIAIRNSGISQTLARLNTLYQYLRVNALNDIEDEVLEENLTRALVASLDDPYAQFIGPDDVQETDESISGTYVGIGVYVSKMDPLFIDWDDSTTYMLQVTSPFPGGPAERAGLKAKDLISHIDGQSIAQMDANEASALLRGREGVPMTLTVHRGDSVFFVSVTPEEVTAPNVLHSMVDGTPYGYISIADFSESTYSLVSEALTNLSSQGMEALVLDLRNNGGGTVNSAQLVANFFLDDGDTVMFTSFKDGSPRSGYETVASDQTRKYRMPIVVIVNAGSASASEILSAALQENGKAVVIGQQTFGKGVMQEMLPWQDGYIRYTSSHYQTPEGNDIDGEGITPDIVVQEPGMSDDQVEEYYDFVYENGDLLSSWIEEHPGYSTRNVEAFADRYSSEVSFDPLYLKVLIRNEYFYSMDMDERPVMDPVYDIYLRTAIEYLDSL